MSWSALPLSRSVLPLSWSTLPMSWSALPLNRSVLPMSWSALPLSWSILPLSWSALPLSWSALPLSRSVLRAVCYANGVEVLPCKNARIYCKTVRIHCRSICQHCKVVRRGLPLVCLVSRMARFACKLVYEVNVCFHIRGFLFHLLKSNRGGGGIYRHAVGGGVNKCQTPQRRTSLT
jgi:hypothetical protein